MAFTEISQLFLIVALHSFDMNYSHGEIALTHREL